MSVAFICDAVRISDRRFSSSSAHELRSVLFSFSIALLVKERLGCGHFRRHTHGIVHRRFVVLQEPRVQLFLRKVKHLAARLVVRVSLFDVSLYNILSDTPYTCTLLEK